MAITIRCLAHASFQIKTDEKVIYIDPATKYMKIKPSELEPADLILVTHSHADHCDPKLIKKIRKLGAPIIAPPTCKDALKKSGVIWEMSAGEFMTVGGLKIRAVKAYNVKRFRPNGEPFHPEGFGVGYVLTAEEKRIYHAGDTDFIPQMELLGDIDVALLPSGDTYTMNMEEAAEAAVAIDPQIAIPMHTKDQNPNVFKEHVERKSGAKVVFLGDDEEYTLE
jgi:L-ascorbate metabolism protein UlaG (beta-lactamase superfamily)